MHAETAFRLNSSRLQVQINPQALFQHLPSRQLINMTDHSITSFNPTKHSDSKTHKATGTQGTRWAVQFSVAYRHPSAYAEWQGKQNIQVNDHPLPLMTDPVGSCAWFVRHQASDGHVRDAHFILYVLQSDVMLRVTSTAICGSDLHLYLNAMPGKRPTRHVILRPTWADFAIFVESAVARS